MKKSTLVVAALAILSLSAGGCSVFYDKTFETPEGQISEYGLIGFPFEDRIPATWPHGLIPVVRESELDRDPAD